MGCWNFTVWDNDECFEFLTVLFSFLGLSALPPIAERRQEYGVYGIIRPGAPAPLIVRHTQEELDESCRLLFDLTAADITRCKEADPEFETRLFEAFRKYKGNLPKLGITREHLWTLIHMHVGLPVDPTRLDSLAHAFDTRENGGTYNIDPYLIKFTGGTESDLEEIRNERAPHIRAGILLYKEKILQGEELKPMQMACFGTEDSITLWMMGVLPCSLPPERVWDGMPAAVINGRART